MEEGSAVLLFNGRDGEWQATVERAERRRGMVSISEQTRAQTFPPELTLFFAPLKKDPTELVIQKGTELGVRRFQPVITARTILPKGGLKMDRLQTIALEAAEQCERLDLPAIHDPLPLEDSLRALPEGSISVFADEAGDDASERWGGAGGRARPMLEAVSGAGQAPCREVLIGPEGGFTPEERHSLRARDDILPVSLGPRILKAETAAITALTLWQAARGDWR
ncbi:MAG: 16S rRNA (uracil(1498)-N(3))-methyltransferase, partial [Pseudomonadota bacterium]